MAQRKEERVASPSSGHQPVMLDAVLQGLNVQPEGRYVDATFGRGGHSRALLASLGEEGRLVAFDRDPEAVAAGLALAAADHRFEMRRGNFADLATELSAASVNGILFDFGVSSPQLDQAERGFSFLRDGPLDMRMDPESGVSAADWLARVTETERCPARRDAVHAHRGTCRFHRRRAASQPRRHPPGYPGIPGDSHRRQR
jgi:16S rRNA (cytosine1402-N4)-methyltransferase